MAQWVKNPTSVQKNEDLIPGLAQWVKGPALLQAAMSAVDTARIWHGCGYGVGWQPNLRFDPWPGNFHMPQMPPLKKKRMLS